MTPHRHRQLSYAAALAVALSSLLVGCDNNEYFITQPAGGVAGDGAGGGGGGGDGSFAFTDPRGDLLPGTASSGAPDVVAVSGRHDDDGLALDIVFTEPVVPWSLAATSSLDGFVDIDLDGDPTTGILSAVNDHGGDAGLGVEYYLALRSADGANVALVNPASKATVLVPAIFEGSTLAIRIPSSALQGRTGQDLRMAMVVGNPDNPATDIAPNNGYWSIPGR